MPRAPLPREDLEVVARGLAAGRRQIFIAEEHGWSKARVNRIVSQLRTEVASKRGPDWLDVLAKSFTEVALEWLRIEGKST